METYNALFVGILIWLFSFSKPVNCEVFTSVVDLEIILHAEYELSQTIDSYIQSERLRLDKLEDVAKEFRKHSQDTLAEPQRKLGNLISAFRTVKRFTVDWNHIFQSYIQGNNVSQGYITEMQNIAGSFPCYEDLKTAAASLLRIQDTYALEPIAMATGKINGMTPGEELNADDCFQLGRLAYDQEDYYHAITWMEHALTINNEDEDSTINKASLYDYLNYAHFQKKNIYRATELVEEWLAFEPDSARALNNLKHYELIKTYEGAADVPETEGSKAKPDLIRPKNDWQQRPTFSNYEALCRGEEVHRPGVKTHDLYCTFARYHPMFTIMPLREEWLNFDPAIRVYHDVLSETDMAQIREIAKPRLHRSGVFQTDSKPSPFTQFRVSKTAWINDSEDPVVRKVSERSSALTNLTLSSVEDLQVVNYGIGGHYEPHYDFSRQGESTSFVSGSGNRIATIIYYVDHVDAGGGTVFPDLGVSVKPEKGACAFWFNLKKNGDGDDRTIHAGCPVLTGMKWIATKWFHEAGNEFNRQCDVQPLL